MTSENTPRTTQGDQGSQRRPTQGKRRGRGDGGLYWSESRQRWIAEVTVGYTPAGRRITRKASDKTKTGALAKLKRKMREYEDGLPAEDGSYTVAQAVEDWLKYGLSNRDANTVKNRRSLAENHVIPDLGARKLAELSADDVDRWLAEKSTKLSTKTLREIRSVLKRAVSRAQARDKVKRNVVLLCEVPTGQPGRPSKALTFEQADALLSAAEDGSAMGAYIVLSLLTGARTEELRELTWSHVVTYVPDRKGWVSIEEAGWQGEEFAVYVWRSVRKGGDTKTVKSRRTLKLPRRCVVALAALWDSQGAARAAGKGAGLVFPDEHGAKRGPMNVLRGFRRVANRADLKGAEWTPRELRHSFVSLLSDSGMPLEQIARLVGHSGTNVTETVYRHQIRPVIQDGATAMDQLFPGSHGEP